MFEESKKLYDRAVAHDAALSQIENQRSGTIKSRKVRVGTAVLLAIATALLIVILVVR